MSMYNKCKIYVINQTLEKQSKKLSINEIENLYELLFIEANGSQKDGLEAKFKKSKDIIKYATSKSIKNLYSIDEHITIIQSTFSACYHSYDNIKEKVELFKIYFKEFKDTKKYKKLLSFLFEEVLEKTNSPFVGNENYFHTFIHSLSKEDFHILTDFNPNVIKKNSYEYTKQFFNKIPNEDFINLIFIPLLNEYFKTLENGNIGIDETFLINMLELSQKSKLINIENSIDFQKSMIDNLVTINSTRQKMLQDSTKRRLDLLKEKSTKTEAEEKMISHLEDRYSNSHKYNMFKEQTLFIASLELMPNIKFPQDFNNLEYYKPLNLSNNQSKEIEEDLADSNNREYINIFAQALKQKSYIQQKDWEYILELLPILSKKNQENFSRILSQLENNIRENNIFNELHFHSLIKIKNKQLLQNLFNFKIDFINKNVIFLLDNDTKQDIPLTTKFRYEPLKKEDVVPFLEIINQLTPIETKQLEINTLFLKQLSFNNNEEAINELLLQIDNKEIMKNLIKNIFATKGFSLNNMMKINEKILFQLFELEEVEYMMKINDNINKFLQQKMATQMLGKLLNKKQISNLKQN